MRTIFMDEHNRFRHDVRLKRRDVIDELTKGQALFPDNHDITDMLAQAHAFYGTQLEPAGQLAAAS